MNLLELANLICEKVRKTDAETVTKCKDYLRVRHEMIWNDQLWRDTLDMTDITIDFDDALNAAGFFLMPDSVAKVVAIRLTDREVLFENLETFFRQDADQFANAGTPLSFTHRSPVVHQFATATDIELANANAGDDGDTVKVRYVDTNDDYKEVSLTAAGADSATQIAGVKWVETVTKPSGNGAMNFQDYANSQTYFSVPAGLTAARRLERVQFIEKPDKDYNAKVLFKRRFTAMTDDKDESLLPTLDNMLIAFAQADLLEHLRHYAKAGQKYAEALALQEQFKRTEILQRANRQRIIPDETAYAYDYDFSSKGYW